MDEEVKKKKIVVSKSKYREEGNKLYVKVERNMLILMMIARMMKLDLRILLYLFDKYKEDVFFWFFMFSGMKVNFLHLKDLVKVIDVVDKYLDTGMVEEGRYGYYLNAVLEKRNNDEIVLSFSDDKFFRFGRWGIIFDNSGVGEGKDARGSKEGEDKESG